MRPRCQLPAATNTAMATIAASVGTIAGRKRRSGAFAGVSISATSGGRAFSLHWPDMDTPTS